MLSKQQKQKYGEILRQQMKQKQQRKKMQQMQKRGNIRQIQPPVQQSPVYKPTIMQKQNTYQRPYVDPKQQLQKKLQNQDYNYFGGVGGGAPNRRAQDQNVTNLRNMSQPNNMRLGVEQMMQYSGNSNRIYQNQYQQVPQQRMRTLSQQPQYYPGQGLPNQNESISPPTMNYPRQSEGIYYPQGGLSSIPGGRLPNPYQQQAAQNYQQYPPSYEYIPQNTKQINSRIQQYPPVNNGYAPQQSYQQNINQLQPLTQQKPNLYPPPQIPQPNLQTQMPYQPMDDPGNDQLQQVFKKGGRNLLKLQNQTIDQHLVKQKRKLQIQKQLKQQIQQAQRRKKQQKQRLKRQQEEQERKHLAYLAQQKRKVEQEQRKARQAKQKIIDDNLRNMQQKKQMQQEAKRKVQRDRLQKQRRQSQAVRQKQQQRRQQQQMQRQKNKRPPQIYPNQQSRGLAKNSGRLMDDDNTSVISSQTSQLQKGFNTALSKQFFRKQRQRINPSINAQNQHFQKVTTQIQKMNHELSQQRRQIQKIIQEKQRAQIDKKKADQQIERLKRQLKRKMDQDNEKLLKALQGDYHDNNFSRLPPQIYKNMNQYEIPQQNQNQYPSFGKKPLRQRQHQNLVQQQYQPQPVKYIPKQQQTNQFEQSQVGLISLDGDSKKIPLYLQHSDKLTMSQVQNFAKDSSFFQKGALNGLNKNSPTKQKYNNRINESIAQQADQDRDYANNQSRKSNRNGKHAKKQSSLYKPQKDELDKLIDSRAKSRGGWGQMSSVNSDITKQIDQLLRRKQNGMGSNNNGRPSSISNAAKQSLSKQGYAYDGLTLNSNVGGTLGTNGTIDLQRINGRNDARLRQLKNLGVQTINTNGDDDLSALDQLLNKYK